MVKILRLFTKNATGVAPDGRLFAGDINALEDAVAALSDLTQNLEVASVAIGESGLQLLRYGAGEARLSGALRTDGVMRGLGGLYAGAYTTAQRDALATPPYGLVITNSTTNQLEMNYGTPAAPAWDSIGVQPPFDTADIADAAITSAKIDETSVATIPVGGVIDWPWASGSIPAWSAMPYGQAVARATHAALAALDTASESPHGVSAGNIVLPDYRGRVGAGIDNMGGVSANRVTVAVSGINGATLGAVGGVEGVTLTTGQLPAHNHSIGGSTGNDSPDHAHSGTTGAGSSHSHGVTDPTHGHGVFHGANAGSSGLLQGINADHQEGPNSATTTSVATGIGIQGEAAHTHPFTSGGASARHTHTLPSTTGSQGSGSAHQNTQPTIIVNKIIRLV